ncbi:MAG: hypothetical protein ACRC9R_10700 [Enterovibrio sp.]
MFDFLGRVIMLRSHLDCVLKDKPKMKARISICPTGLIKVRLENENVCYSCDIEKICFEHNGKTVCLVGCSKKNEEPWKFTLSKKDAQELKKRIAEMDEMVEILMRDLI